MLYHFLVLPARNTQFKNGILQNESRDEDLAKHDTNVSHTSAGLAFNIICHATVPKEKYKNNFCQFNSGGTLNNIFLRPFAYLKFCNCIFIVVNSDHYHRLLQNV